MAKEKKSKKENEKAVIGRQESSIQREFSAGGTVYKKLKRHSVSRNGKKFKLEVVWLITKSSPSIKIPVSIWRLPKGLIDVGEEVGDTALREVEEEGGVEAKIIKKIETQRFFYTFEGKRIMKFVTYYLMEWIKDLPGGPGLETSEIAWLSYEEARKKLKHQGEKLILDKANELLSSGLQESLI